MNTKKKKSSEVNQPSFARFSFPFAVVLAIVVFYLNMQAPPGTDDGAAAQYSVAEQISRTPLSAQEVQNVGQAVQSLWANAKPDLSLIPDSLKSGEAAVFASFRRSGQSQYEVWRRGSSAYSALEKALDAGRERLKKTNNAPIDTIELNLAHSFITRNIKDDKRALSNIYRGIRGVEFIYDKKPTRYAPTKVLATNRSLKNLIKVFAEKENLTVGQVSGSLVRTRTFEADQMLVQLSPEKSVKAMVRGNQLVTMEEVTAKSVREMADAHISWMKQNLQPNGRMVYKYWPSRGDESKNNNMIRQWMATVCMDRIAKANGDQPFYDRVATNIRYNLANWYQEEDGLGLIEYQGKVKLGAIALAALAMVEHPKRAEFAKYEKGILKTMDHLWHDDGSFTTFYKSPGIRDKHSNANFYPGEALVLWAALYEESKDADLLKRFMKTFRFYREWHLEGTNLVGKPNRNPAFIPWHTQAYYTVWKITRDKELQEFVFTMNDWLLDVQQWDSAKRFPDTQGRFYDPTRPFGPPHASSTGVYLEGLIDAHQMAKLVGDTEREEKYRRAIVRGLRSIMQLTYMDDVDMYYVSNKDKVYGGVRTTVYHNEIRVDNIQHNLMGILKILDAFEETDYRP